MRVLSRFLAPALLLLAAGSVPAVAAEAKLPPLGKAWREANPYRGNAKAAAAGAAPYNQMCARCHGENVEPSGIAPDLRRLDTDAEGDKDYLASVRRGKVRNGTVYMPPFDGILPQETVWAIKTYIESVAAQ